MAMTIGILTGGGDAPGLNACIETVVRRAERTGTRVIGIRRGWAGLLYNRPDRPDPNLAGQLRLNDIRGVDRSGGTFLHTSRTNPAAVSKADWPDGVGPAGYVESSDGRRDYTAHVLKVIEGLKLDVLIPIGGDDTLSYAARLDAEGLPLVAVPKTMDNDVYGTEFCIGFSTAVTRSVDFITALRTTFGSHESIGLVELFGRHSGETALLAAYLAGADRALISEVPFDPERLAELLVRDRTDNPSNYAVAAISEGATMIGGKRLEYGEEDAYGHKTLGGIGQATAEAIAKITGQKTQYQKIAYLMRSGAPDALDRMAAISFANLAMELIEKREFGRMVALRDGKYTHVPAGLSSKGIRSVDVEALYDAEAYRPRIRSMLGQPMFLR